MPGQVGRTGRMVRPLPVGAEGGGGPPVITGLRAIPVETGRPFIAQHHSRLPVLQRGPWKFVFGFFDGSDLLAVAFWHNPSARGLPNEWLELRRMAVKDSAPRFTASKMMGAMYRWFKKNTNCPRLVSYHDVAVHNGTIYRASGWVPTHVSRPRNRDRSKPRSANSPRLYRTDSNGKAPAASAKIRWEKSLLRGEVLHALSVDQIEAAKTLTPTR